MLIELNVGPGDLRRGDTMTEKGMEIRVDYRTGNYPGTGPHDAVHGWAATILNVPEILAKKIVPASFLYDAERHLKGPGHGREDYWRIQCDGLRVFTIRREVPDDAVAEAPATA